MTLLYIQLFSELLNTCDMGVLSTMLNVPESDYCTVTQLHEAIPADSVSTIQTALDELYAKEYVIRLDGSTYAVNKLKLFQMKLI